MPRLPQPGADSGSWGDILNDFLSQVHTASGTLKPDSVGASQLQTDAVTASALAPNSVTSQALAPNSITNAAIASDAVTAASIADGAITGVQLADGVRASLSKADSALQSSDITGKADDSAVLHKAGTETVTGSKDFTGGITVNGTNIVVTSDTRLSDARTPTDNSVTTAKLQDGAVTSTKIADGTITSSDISNTAAITKAQLANGVQASLDKADSALQSAPVASVNTKTGVVTLTKSDVGLGNVDNTSDANKPISTATQTALDRKASLYSAYNDANSGKMLPAHMPENSGFIGFVGLMNDIAFNNTRGGSTAITKNGSVYVGTPTNCYKPDATFDNLAMSGTDTYVIEVTFCRPFTYGQLQGIAFTGTAWMCTQVKIETYDGTAGTWTIKADITNNTSPVIYVQASPGGTNQNTKIRYTLGGTTPNGSIRIGSIFALGYDSSLLSSGFVDRSGGALYGQLQTSLDPVADQDLARKYYIDNLFGRRSATVQLGPASNQSINFANGATSHSMEIGRTDGTASTPYIDFHSVAGSNDYDARIIANGGTAGTSGAGTLSAIAQQLTVSATLLLSKGLITSFTTRTGNGGPLFDGTSPLVQVCDTSASSITLNLIASTTPGAIIMVVKGDSSTNTVTINGTIDGVATTVLAKRGDSIIISSTTAAGAWVSLARNISTDPTVLSPVPASATATGTPGQIAQDGNYMYICVAANTWKRSPLSTW